MMTALAAAIDTISPAPQSVVAIVNPRAGMGRGQRALELLNTQNWSAEVKTFPTLPDSLDGHRAAIEYARQHQADRLLVCGGDGTLMATLTTMLSSGPPIPICMIPAGTGNIVANDLATPRRLLPALRQAFRPGRLCWWDAGRIEGTGQIFALRASAGHDALTVANTPDIAKQRWGTFGYVLPAIRQLLRLKPITFTLAIDGGVPFQVQGITAFVAVTNRMAGIIDFVLSPDIHPDDGVLHVGVIHPHRLALLQLPMILNQGSLSPQNMVTIFPVRERVRIEANPPQPLQVDGELLAELTPLEVRTMQHAITFVTPLSKDI